MAGEPASLLPVAAPQPALAPGARSEDVLADEPPVDEPSALEVSTALVGAGVDEEVLSAEPEPLSVERRR
jgi:hypothetical protein